MNLKFDGFSLDRFTVRNQNSGNDLAPKTIVLKRQKDMFAFKWLFEGLNFLYKIIIEET